MDSQLGHTAAAPLPMAECLLAHEYSGSGPTWTMSPTDSF